MMGIPRLAARSTSRSTWGDWLASLENTNTSKRLSLMASTMAWA
jgi:hypothetical protein